MNFDEMTERRGTDSAKWDKMQAFSGVSPDDGIPMWVADMDFRAPDFLQDAVKGLLERANYGYFSGMESYFEAVRWWMQTRHDWACDPSWMFVTYGLGNGIAMALQTFTEPGDGVVTFTPVYHEFEAKIRKTGRVNTQLPMIVQADGTYAMDFDAYDAMLTGGERLVLISSPHNPAGRVWRRDELNAIADFCLRHDLLLISDEIHHDLILPGHRHVPMPVAAPQIEDRLIVMTSGSKTFNIAGARTGCVIIPDAKLRQRFADFHRSLDMSPNLLGITLTRAAYSPAGAAWVDELTAYIAGNAQLFSGLVNAIPGLAAMPMQSTYLAWVDFAGTGMTPAEFLGRIHNDARIAPTPGTQLGQGGATFLRFNLGTQRARVAEAGERLQAAFSDLQ
ncbi:MAG: MalY/PatB family protein [Jhaorihella sp.]